MNKDQKEEVVDADRRPDQGGARPSSRSTTAGSASRRQRSCAPSLRQADATFQGRQEHALRCARPTKPAPKTLKPVVADGPTALAFVHGDPAVAAKALDTFARQAQLLEFKGGVMGDNGRSTPADVVRQLARLPGRDQLTRSSPAGMVGDRR